MFPIPWSVVFLSGESAPHSISYSAATSCWMNVSSCQPRRSRLRAAHVCANKYVTNIAGKHAFHLRMKMHPNRPYLSIQFYSADSYARAPGKPDGAVALYPAQRLKRTCHSLRRARYKFPGRQDTVISGKRGFMSVDRDEY
ncbi:hypothetical protein BD410DRAFT_856084, partial [Rickenella mellea]